MSDRLPRDMRQDNFPALKLTCAEFNALLEYSSTVPTGTTIGKRWKRHHGAFDRSCVYAPYWLIGEYVEGSAPGWVAIAWYRPIICVRAATNA